MNENIKQESNLETSTTDVDLVNEVQNDIELQNEVEVNTDIEADANVVEDVSYEVGTVGKVKKVKSEKGYALNPFYKKIKDAPKTKAATFASISVKTLVFIALNIVGMLSPLFAPELLVTLPAFIIALVLTTASAFVCYFVPVTIPVFGIIYSIGQGFVLSLICGITEGLWQVALLFYLIVTLSVLLNMLLLYTIRIIKYPKKVLAVSLSVIGTIIISSVLIFISGFFSPLIILVFVGSGVLGIILLLTLILLTVFNLNIDFFALSRYLQEGLHKKYEWLCAFSFIITIPMFFIRAVETVIKAVNKIRGGL